MDFVAGAQSILSSDQDSFYARGFTERLRVAASGGKHAESRSIAAPYYLNDLGVRRFEDPKIFFSEHVKAFGWETLFEAQESTALLASSSIRDLAPLLDALILLTGDYEVADEVVGCRLGEISDSSDYALLIYSGVVLASRSDPQCRPPLLRAATTSSDEIDAFMARHRLAAAEIKRLGDVEAGMEVLDDADGRLDSSFQRGAVAPGDRSALLAVSANLRALALLRLGLDEEASNEALRSRSLSTHRGLVKVDASASARYASQESINVAQLKIAAGEVEIALEILRENAPFAESFCSDYLSEALTAYAYSLFLMERHVEAVSVAQAAEEIVLLEGSPQRLRAIREILAAAMSESGAIEDASRVVMDIDLDPIGLRRSRSSVVPRGGVPE